MKITPLAIPDVLLIEPQLYEDSRGHFFESFNEDKFSQAIGRHVHFVQDNESFSRQGVLRGLHYQTQHPQGKLVRVTQGEIFDVAVDLRKHSATFGKWVGERLSADNKKQLWIPEGLAHGFLVLSQTAQFQYKVTDYWYAQHECCIYFDDPDLRIQWPSLTPPCTIALSDKDQAGVAFKQAPIFA